MGKIKHTKLLTVLIGFFLLSFSILVFSMVYANHLPMIIEQINNGTIGVILTAIVTVFLLDQQSKTEEVKEKSGVVFAQKLDVYHKFLDKLHEILKDGEITIDQKNGKDELSDLISHLATLKMHASEDKVKEIFEKLVEIIKYMELSRCQLKKGEQYYSIYATNLFGIVSLLKKDLYSNVTDKDAIDEKLIKKIVGYKKFGVIAEIFLNDLFVKLGKLHPFNDGIWEIPDQSTIFDFNFEIKKVNCPYETSIGIADYDSDRVHFYIWSKKTSIFQAAKIHFKDGDANNVNWWSVLPNPYRKWDENENIRKSFFLVDSEGKKAIDFMTNKLVEIAIFVDDYLKEQVVDI